MPNIELSEEIDFPSSKFLFQPLLPPFLSYKEVMLPFPPLALYSPSTCQGYVQVAISANGDDGKLDKPSSEGQ